jgi:DNA primase
MKTISIEEALSNRHGGDWRTFTCPAHADASPSARVHAPTGYWVCMSCHAKGKAKDVFIDVDLQVEYAYELLHTNFRIRDEAELDQYDISGPGDYWPTRFSLEACKAFRLGQDGEYPVYPVHAPDGSYMGVVKRNPYGERPKYRDPKGVPTGDYLFGYDKAEPHSEILLVEGAPDVIGAWDAGITALGTYTSRLSDAQLDLIVALEPSFVVVGYDADASGETGSYDAIRGLLGAGILTGKADLRGYHDVDSMPLNLRRGLLDSVQTIDYFIDHGRGY